MTQDHPITPTPELVNKIFGDAMRGSSGQHDYELRMIHAAYAAGADQELEATLGLMTTLNIRGVDYVRNARRSARAPSLKEEALLVIDTAVNDYRMSSDAASIIRRALERLND
jgi:hypothetical protein